MVDLLLITPPFTQLNTPYPATAYLKGFLNTKGISSYQIDLGIEVILELFSSAGLKAMFDLADELEQIQSENAHRIFSLRAEYIQKIEAVIRFLQGNNPTLARLICSHNFLPQASRFAQLEELEWAFGNMGHQDKAKHLATLFLEDISDFIVECVDEHFGFSRYAERLGRSANSFDELYEELQYAPTFIDQISLQLIEARIEELQPKLVCFSIPFPGNLYSGFKCAQFIKEQYSHIKVAMGGGFANTELRSVSDKRVFEFFDYITLDDGELPIEILASNTLDPSPDNANHQLFKRTFLIEKGEVNYNNLSLRQDYKQSELGTPDYSDLPLSEYISVIEVANPMHSLWSDGRWNKLTMAHGCYWGKCTFCDISLDYIKNYEPVAATLIVDRMEQLMEQTGETGFHFVDEAAPPALMRAVAIEIIKRKLVVSWWTNIRFEKSFSRDLCKLLKASGCIAVSGGLEVASDRLLELIQKGVSVKQVAQVTHYFTEAGIMVHAYLMYGYPTQSIQETVDSLEMVRQLFEQGVIQSGFWHQFALTAHSPVGLAPEAYGILPDHKKISFANNDIQFEDSTGIDHDQFSFGLKKSLFNYMHGLCFDYPLQDWFDFKIPQTKIPPVYIEQCIAEGNKARLSTKATAKVIWLGGLPLVERQSKKRKGQSHHYLTFTLFTQTQDAKIRFDLNQGEWLLHMLEKTSIHNNENSIHTYRELKNDYEQSMDDFELFWYSKSMIKLREMGLLVL